jgi:hypothetical protein
MRYYTPSFHSRYSFRSQPQAYFMSREATQANCVDARGADDLLGRHQLEVVFDLGERADRQRHRPVR